MSHEVFHSDFAIISKDRPEGWWKTVVRDRQGRLLGATNWQKNLVVAKVGELMAWLLKEGGASSPPFGAQYYAIGEGLASWDTSLPSADLTDTALTAELTGSRKAPANFTFLDASDAATSAVTGKIQFDVTYDTTELNTTTWREFAVFGGNAEASPSFPLDVTKNYMINHVIHPAFPKTNQISVQRITRFTF
jgi:hypothetical protein